MNSRWMLIAGTLGCGLAVALGAIGTHALERFVPEWYTDAPRRLEAWRSAVHWQAVHALALLVLAHSRQSGSRAGRAVAVLFVAGIVLFSGCIYGWVLSGWPGLVAPVPVGGILFLLAWAVWTAAALLMPAGDHAGEAGN